MQWDLIMSSSLTTCQEYPKALLLNECKVFVKMLLYNAENFFTKEVIDLDYNINKPGSSKAVMRVELNSGQANFEKNVKTLDKKIKELYREIFRRRFDDNLIMAFIRKEFNLQHKQRRQNDSIRTYKQGAEINWS